MQRLDKEGRKKGRGDDGLEWMQEEKKGEGEVIWLPDLSPLGAAIGSEKDTNMAQLVYDNKLRFSLQKCQLAK